MTETRRLATVDDFFPEGAEMRRVFDERLRTRHGGPRERFVWDYWHVPDQYTYIRTFADEFFPPDLYRRFHDHLIAWGRETLGCTNFVRPWLSYYIDGCRQELHADVPHGPWAWLFSLTNWDERTFTGGETLLLAQSTLDFWRGYDRSRSAELSAFAELVEPRFNRLTVFDPRIPHGVRLVEGTREPLDSRIAIHSWFVDPAVVVSDAIEEAQQRRAFEAVHAILVVSLRDVEGLDGLVATRIAVSPEGVVTDTQVVSSSLVSTTGDGDAVVRVERAICQFLADTRFPPVPRDAWAVIPVSFPLVRQ